MALSRSLAFAFLTHVVVVWTTVMQGSSSVTAFYPNLNVRGYGNSFNTHRGRECQTIIAMGYDGKHQERRQGGLLGKIVRDYRALRCRVTARHILLPPQLPLESMLTLKQTIRNRVGDSNLTATVTLEESFATAAERFSLDVDTKDDGGLLGRRFAQGYLRADARALERACFEVPLGQVSGPIVTDFGQHLLLVTERFGCTRLDGEFTRIGPDGRPVRPSNPDTGDVDENDPVIIGGTELLGQIGLWIGVALGGGVLAELSATAAGVLDTLPWEQ